jgi:DNA-binding NarL/FixJ family response regulator
MPKLDASEVLNEIRLIDPNVRSIVLTTFDCASDAIRAVTAGAKAYLTKDLGREELLNCIRKVNSGGTCIQKGFIETMTARIAREKSSEGDR